MLFQRVITAVVLLAVFLPALFFPSPVLFGAVTLIFMIGAGWEWARLQGCSPWRARLMGLLLGAGLAGSWWQWGLDWVSPHAWWGVAALWLLMLPALLKGGVPGWAKVARPLRLWTGSGLIAAAWWALAQAHALGAEMLLSILALVWTADIAAYFGGRALGRRKLAPSISPGKSWEGVWSGWLGVLVLAALWLHFNPQGDHLYARLWQVGPVWTAAALALLVASSVCGDLVESLVKRSAGVKDSSALLPGHGGVLDRIDALLPVLPMAMMLLSLGTVLPRL